MPPIAVLLDCQFYTYDRNIELLFLSLDHTSRSGSSLSMPPTYHSLPLWEYDPVSPRRSTNSSDLLSHRVAEGNSDASSGEDVNPESLRITKAVVGALNLGE